MASQYFRVCDRRVPFLWATADQPAGRWHARGEGLCHHLSTSPKAAWAEALRHHEITDEDGLAGMEQALWLVEAEHRIAETVVLFGRTVDSAAPTEPRGLPAAEGHADRGLLADVRHL